MPGEEQSYGPHGHEEFDIKTEIPQDAPESSEPSEANHIEVTDQSSEETRWDLAKAATMAAVLKEDGSDDSKLNFDKDLEYRNKKLDSFGDDYKSKNTEVALFRRRTKTY